MAKAYIRLFYSFNRDVSALTMEERGRLITAIIEYAETGVVDESLLTGNERILFPVFRNQVDREAEAYEAQVRQNRLNGAKGGRPPKASKNPAGFSETEKSQDKDKEKDKEKEKEEKDKYKGEGEGKDKEGGPGEGPDGPEPTPALDEIRDYCRENALKVDAQTFWNYYEANGWTAGGRPIRSWRAKLREWDARDGTAAPRRSPTRPEPVNPALNYEQREYRDEDFGPDFFFL